MPVSSSAQLTLLPWLLRWEPAADRTGFAAGLHAGSCAGLVVALAPDLRALDRRTAGQLALSTLPAAAAGLLGQSWVEHRLGGPRPMALVGAVAAALLWQADRGRTTGRLDGTAVAAASAAQVVALVPGVSRAGATLTALRWRGVPRAEALRFSMLMSLPVTAGAAGLTSVRARRAPDVLPTALAAVSAWATWRGVATRPRMLVRGAAVYRLGTAAAVVARHRSERS